MIDRSLRTPAQERTIDLAVTDRYTDLPPRFQAMQGLTLTDGRRRRLDYYPPEQIRQSDVWDGSESGLYEGRGIRAYSMEGTQLIVAPEPTGEIHLTMSYIESFPPMIQGADTNWLAQNAPDIYVWGMLHHAAVESEDGELEAKYGDMFRRALGELSTAENRARTPSGSGLRVISSNNNPRRIV